MTIVRGEIVMDDKVIVGSPHMVSTCPGIRTREAAPESGEIGRSRQPIDGTDSTIKAVVTM
jgi:hypothetical protein